MASFRYTTYCKPHFKRSWPQISLRNICTLCGIWLRSFCCADHVIPCKVRNLIDNCVFWTSSWQRSGTPLTANHISNAVDHRYHCEIYALYAEYDCGHFAVLIITFIQQTEDLFLQYVQELQLLFWKMGEGQSDFRVPMPILLLFTCNKVTELITLA